MAFLKNKYLSALLGTTLLLAANQGVAGLIITTGGQVATDGSGLTSSFVDASNKIDPTNGYLIETFDAATKMIGFEGFPQDKSFNWSGLDEIGNAVSAGCGVNSSGSISVTGNLGVKGDGTSNDHGVGAPPGGNHATIGDKTCFGFTPGEGIGNTVTVDYSGFLTGGDKIDYLGFYWGSIDAYNNFTFFDSSTNTSETLLGSTLLAQSGGTPGNQNGLESNLYINIKFEDFAFDSFMVTSTGVAGEFDNIVVGLQSRNIPEPATIAMFGLALLGLMRIKRTHH
ncbi:hypothetical protein GCM10009111_24740 [Colwellia asteriadis]|uniref:Ice-binding protein C-terminal domain-containing protein n=1 Tax=Colwellia asteriadis TaxID=517723 RepID=A0ABN1L8Q8_9GAMM